MYSTQSSSIDLLLLIVDAFVAYEQPVFIFIPPFAEIHGGAYAALDASINASIMEMYT